MKFAVLAMSLVSLLAPGESKNIVKAPEAEPKPCCTASQFEISFGANSAATAMEPGNSVLQEYLVGAFDFDDHKYGMNVTVRQFGGNTTQYSIFMLFNKGEIYVVQGEDCFKMPTSQGEEPGNCVPDTAYYAGSVYLGNNDLLVNNWFMTAPPAAGFDGEIYGSTTSDDCTPVGITAVGIVDGPQGEKVGFIESGSYFNFTEGIKNPDQWFVPPPSCNNATVLAKDTTWQPMHFWKRMRATKVFL